MTPHPAQQSANLPRVAVLLATRNGVRFLPEQVASILDQSGVSVRIIALDDLSTDGTAQWLDQAAETDPRISRLPSTDASGSSAANFVRLIRRADVAEDELVAFADQDDVWVAGKLARHAAMIASGTVEGVSSNVTSFTAEGTRTLVRKSDPQRRFDYLLQSPGPGSTFLISPRLFRLVREVAEQHPELVARVDFHDSLIYVIARASELPWHIDPFPSVDYRQHDDNVIGSNVGARSAMSRLELIRSRWHRRQATAMAEVALRVATEPLATQLQQLLELFARHDLRARLHLARMSSQFRRRPRDRAIIGILIAVGIW